MKNYKQGWLFHLRSERIIVLLVLLASVFIYRCGTMLYIPAAPDAERAGVALDTLLQGRQLYIHHCGSCHTLYLPERYSAAEWNKNISEMQRKATISDAEKEIILKYLTSNKPK